MRFGESERIVLLLLLLVGFEVLWLVVGTLPFVGLALVLWGFVLVLLVFAVEAWWVVLCLPFCIRADHECGWKAVRVVVVVVAGFTEVAIEG